MPNSVDSKRLLKSVFLCTSVFLISPAFAQVLGPAPDSRLATRSGPSETGVSFAGANLNMILAEHNLKAVGEMTRRKHHVETDATRADGQRVTVSFDLSGRLWEIENTDYDHYRSTDAPRNPRAAIEAVSNAGFFDPALHESRRYNVVVRAKTVKGEPVELSVDRAGVIYKQVWVR